jgi:hypothetical protein
LGDPTLASSTSCDIVGVANVEFTNERTATMATDTTFTPQVLGETEKALNAILYRELDKVGLNEHQWITLQLTKAAGARSPASSCWGGSPGL